MELKQLEYFMAIAKYGSFTKAASILCVAQPALSQSIKNLENELGVKLFDRVSKGVVLNKAGLLLVNELPPIMKSIHVLPHKIKDIDEITKNTITIVLHAASVILTQCLVEYKRKNSKVIFKMFNDPNILHYDLLLDTLLPNERIDKENILFTEPLLLAVPISSPLADYDSIDLADTAREDYVCPDLFQPLRIVCDKYCRDAGFYPHVAFENTRVELVRDLICAGLGIGFWPQYSWKEVQTMSRSSKNAHKLIRINEPKCTRAIKIIKSPNLKTDSVAADFYNFLKNYYTVNELQQIM